MDSSGYRVLLVADGAEVDVAAVADSPHIAFAGQAIGAAGIESREGVEGRGELPLGGQDLNGFGAVLLGADPCRDGELVDQVEGKLEVAGSGELRIGECYRSHFGSRKRVVSGVECKESFPPRRGAGLVPAFTGSASNAELGAEARRVPAVIGPAAAHKRGTRGRRGLTRFC